MYSSLHRRPFHQAQLTALFGTKISSSDPTLNEVDLVQADGGWKLRYSASAAKDWTVVDLGSFYNEGELLIAADDRLAELLQWPELAQETTLLRRQSRQVGSAGDAN